MHVCPVYLAIKHGHCDALAVLLQHEDIYEDDERLILASQYGHTHICKYLLDIGMDHFSDEALHAAVRYGHIEVVKLLLDYGVNMEPFNEHDETPLCHAIGKGSRDIAKLLIERGADTDIWDIGCQHWSNNDILEAATYIISILTELRDHKIEYGHE
jgi:hypothetical protein